MSSSRFVVGIDLGTTNLALSYWDALAPEAPSPTSAGASSEKGGAVALHDLAIPQLVQPGQIEEKPLLPSFLYLSAPNEFPTGSLDLPWAKGRDFAVGELARAQGLKVPTRQVVSAKSWLCHHGVDRRAPILPWKSPPGSRMVSPIEACALYLQELVFAWNQVHPNDPLGSQDVVLTVPASFDAVARELTLEAAARAGLTQVQLFEEPQSAFYAWIQSRQETWRREVEVGEVILVCDIGGGTTDFSLILVGQAEGNLELSRLAVGDHILLGGDNMDWALAHFAAKKFEAKGHKLDAAQMLMLLASCRAAKESLLGENAPKSMEVRVLGRGSRLMAGSLKEELTREEIHSVLLEGFLPVVDLQTPVNKARSFGLQEMGLPYASDPAISRHMAQFLRRQADAIAEKLAALGKSGSLPTALLFNGGVLKSQGIRDRVVGQVNQWRQAAGQGPVKVLEHAHLDLAVARGATVHGLAKRGHGIRIRGGSARSYYLGVEIPAPAVPGALPPIKALCVVPHGMEEGQSREIPGVELSLLVGETAHFRFFGSNRRREDQLGEWLDPIPEELEELPGVETALPSSSAEEWVPVRLKTVLTDVGALELWCQTEDVSRQWRLEFNTRAGL